MPVRKGVGSYRSVDNPLDRNRALRELVQPIAKPHDGGDGGDGKRNLTTARHYRILRGIELGEPILVFNKVKSTSL